MFPGALQRDGGPGSRLGVIGRWFTNQMRGAAGFEATAFHQVRFQEQSGMRARVRGHGFRCSGDDQSPPLIASFRAQVD